MKSNIFLTSSAHAVIHHIGEKLDVKNKHQKVLFIKTAAEIEEKEGEDMQWMIDSKNAFIKAGFEVREYTVTGKKKEQIEKDLDNTDIIYIEGGDTFYLLYQLRETGAFNLIRDQVKNGKIYIGTSAGSMVSGPDIQPFEKIESKPWISKVKDTRGMGLVDIVIFPHWGNEYFRDLYLNHRLNHAYNAKYKKIILSDNQYIEVLQDGIKFIDVNDENN